MLKDNIAVALFAWTVLWSVGSAVAHWAIARSRATKAELSAIRAEMELKAEQMRVDGHEKKLTEHDRRVQTVEGIISGLPTLSLFHDLALDLKEVRGNVDTLGATLRVNTEVTRRIEDFLLNSSKARGP